MVEDYCTARGPSKLGMCGGAECTYFLDGILKKGVFPTSSMLCRLSSPNDTVAFVQVYGGGDTGPYYNPERGFHDDFHLDTPDRINASIRGYFERVGAPDLVTFNSVLWDVSRLYRDTYGGWNSHIGQGPTRGEFDVVHSPLYDAAVAGFEADLRKRLQDIETALGSNLRTTDVKSIRARMGVRTAVSNMANGRLLHAYNDIIRRVARELNVLLYDYDVDVWSTVSFDVAQEKKVMRDAIHPLATYTMAAALKMMRSVYSSAMITPETTSGDPRVWCEGSSEPRPARITKVMLLQNSAFTPAPRMSWNLSANSSSSDHHHHGGLFLAVAAPDNAIRLRLSNVPAALLAQQALGPSDVLRLPRAQLEAIPLGPPIPHEFFQPGVRIAVNTTGQLWLVADGTRRIVPQSALTFFNATLLDASTPQRGKEGGRERAEEDFLPFLVPAVLPPVPDIYSAGKLLRWVGSREVYVLLSDLKLHLVPSGAVFIRHGWDFGSVVVVGDKRDLDLLSYGDPIS